VSTSAVSIFVKSFGKITELGFSTAWGFAIFMGVAPDIALLSTDESKILDSVKMKCQDIATKDHQFFCEDRYKPISHRSLIQLYVLIYAVIATMFLIFMRLAISNTDVFHTILDHRRKQGSADEYTPVYAAHYVGTILMTGTVLILRAVLFLLLHDLTLNQTNGVSSTSFIERWYCPAGASNLDHIRKTMQARMGDKQKAYLPARVRPSSDLKSHEASHAWIENLFFRLNTNGSLFGPMDHNKTYVQVDGTLTDTRKPLVRCYTDKWVAKTLVLRYVYAMMAVSSALLLAALVYEICSFCKRVCCGQFIQRTQRNTILTNSDYSTNCKNVTLMQAADQRTNGQKSCA